MIRCAGQLWVAFAVLAAGTFAQAQSLGEPAAVKRTMDVAQFGMPRDAKLIFCDSQDCPERSTKTLTLLNPVLAPLAPPPPPAVSAVVPALVPALVLVPHLQALAAQAAPDSSGSPGSPTSAHAKPLKKPKKKAARKQHQPRIDCGPDLKR